VAFDNSHGGCDYVPRYPLIKRKKKTHNVSNVSGGCDTIFITNLKHTFERNQRAYTKWEWKRLVLVEFSPVIKILKKRRLPHPKQVMLKNPLSICLLF
jgi:hypothetical protein